MSNVKHLLYCPLTGLGLYGGHRGSRWLKNRIKIFKQFVIPSLLNQTSQNFILWISGRPEDRNSAEFYELKAWLDKSANIDYVFTFGGICFYDDKYPDDQARERLLTALSRSMGDLINAIEETEYVLMTIQPSDDLYEMGMVESVQKFFDNNSDYMCVGYSRGYICNYLTKEVREYNPKTNPPFYTVKFTREDFIDPLKHCNHTAIKRNIGKYEAGTPCPSHEYIGEAVKYKQWDRRGFLVGCHGENISTHFNHPYGGEIIPDAKTVLLNFGIYDAEPLKIRLSIRKWLMRKLPHGWQRKLRYWFGERFYAKFYKFIRS